MINMTKMSWLKIGLIAWVIGLALKVIGVFGVPFWWIISIVAGALVLKFITKIEWKSLIVFYILLVIVVVAVAVMFVPLALIIISTGSDIIVWIPFAIGVIISLPLKLFVAWLLFKNFEMK